MTYQLACQHDVTPPRGYSRWGKRKLAAWRLGLCPVCRRAQADRETLTASRALGLCYLSGTDRQVTWAYALRYRALWAAAALLTGRGVDTQRDAALLAELRDVANRYRSASWWIGARHAGAEALLVAADYAVEGYSAPGAPRQLEMYAPAPW
jgi:hypothetical protein